MIFKKQLLSGLVALIAICLIQSCASTKSATNINNPQQFLNSYQETIDAVGEALVNTNMHLESSNFVNDTTYYVKFYRKRYQFSANPNAKKGVSFMTELTIKKLGENRTQVKIDEDDQRDMVANSIPDSPGKDMLKELNKLLKNELLVAQEKEKATPQ